MHIIRPAPLPLPLPPTPPAEDLSRRRELLATIARVCAFLARGGVRVQQRDGLRRVGERGAERVQTEGAKRKVELLVQLIRGEKKLVDVCREHDRLKQSEVEGWMDTCVKAGERGSRRTPMTTRRLRPVQLRLTFGLS